MLRNTSVHITDLVLIILKVTHLCLLNMLKALLKGKFLNVKAYNEYSVPYTLQPFIFLRPH